MSSDGRKEHRNPTPTVDIIIEVPGGVVLIERKNPPHGWAIPGGFVDEGEPLWVAARREAKEETSLEVELLVQFHC
jgi:ADP-ribose pyrophosphatase YjhB (NUDIX family)